MCSICRANNLLITERMTVLGCLGDFGILVTILHLYCRQKKCAINCSKIEQQILLYKTDQISILHKELTPPVVCIIWVVVDLAITVDVEFEFIFIINEVGIKIEAAVEVSVI